MAAGDTAKDKAANLMAHALLSAVEFQVTGKDPLTGAIAGVTGEATAEIIARAYGKPVSELTANEKENISTLSQLAGGLAAALTAKANGVSNQNGGGMALAVAGAETSKRAVENNFSFIEMAKNPEYTTGLGVKAQADEIIKPAEDKAIENALDRGLPQYVALDAGVYKFGGKIAINARTGDVFYSQAPTLSVISGPNLSTKLGFGIEMGWIPTLDHDEIQDIGRSINNVLVFLNKRFNKKFIFLFRAHHTMKINMDSEYCIDVTNYPDMQELLCASDVLITDYSSCMGDMALMGKPIFLYTPDLDEYIKDRGFYWDIYSLPFPIAKTEEEFLENIKNFNSSNYLKGVESYFFKLGTYESKDSIKKTIDWLSKFI